MKSGVPTVSSSVKPDETAAPSSDQSLVDRFLQKTSAAPKASQPQPPPKSDPGFMMKSVLELGGGESFSERYENSGFRKAMESIIPEDVEKSESGQYVSRFLAEAYRAMPQALDFITSPTGIGLIAAHSFPLTRPIAAAADYGLALYSGKQAVDAAREFSKDKSPENLARLATAIAGAYMGMKGGKKVEGADAPRATERYVKAVTERAGEEVRRKTLTERLKDAAPYTEEGDKAPNKSQLLAAKVEILNEVAAPKGFWDKVVDRASKAPLGIGDISRSVLRLPMPELMNVSQDLVKDRAVFEATNKFKVSTVLHGIEQTVSPEERSIYSEGPDGAIVPSNKMAAVIQGTVTAKQAGLTPEATRGVEVIRKLNHESVKLLKTFYGDDVSVLDPDEYLTQVWEMPKPGSVGDTPRSRAARTLMRDRFLKERKFDDYAEGIAAGWKPKFNDVNELVKMRWDYLTRSIANQRLANTFNDIGAVATRSQRDTLGLHDWVEMEDTPALNRAAYQDTQRSERVAGRGDNKHVVEVEKNLYQSQAVYMHPDFAPAAKAVFGKRWSPPSIATLERIRSFGKRMNLLGSFFHQWAITEQSQALTASQEGAAAGLKKWWFAEPEAYKGLRRGIVEVVGKNSKDDLPIFRANRELVMDGLQNGLRLQVEDAEKSTRSFLTNVGKDSDGWRNAITAPLRAMGHVEHIVDRSLWDFYLPSQMIHSYELGVDAAISKLGEHASADMIGAAKRATAEQVNDAYGAISWEKMLVNPKTAQFLNWVFLAPGWKASNLRVFTQAFEGSLGREMAMNYTRGAAVTWFISAQVGNLINTAVFKNKDKDGNVRPHFTWDNPGVPTGIPGINSNFGAIAAGYNPNGSQRYINWGKGLLDPIKLAMDPHAWFANAMSGPMQALGAAMYGVDPVTGFRYVDQYGSTTEQNIQRIELALPVFVPFSLRDPIRAINDKRFTQIYPMPGGAGTLFNVVGLPTRQGINYTRAKEAYISAMKANDPQSAMIILRLAQDSKLNPKSIDQEWKKYAASQRKKNAPSGPVYGITGELEQ